MESKNERWSTIFVLLAIVGSTLTDGFDSSGFDVDVPNISAAH
jgi:hypothetical protein